VLCQAELIEEGRDAISQNPEPVQVSPHQPDR
jgi:hypothetical protein